MFYQKKGINHHGEINGNGHHFDNPIEFNLFVPGQLQYQSILTKIHNLNFAQFR